MAVARFRRTLQATGLAASLALSPFAGTAKAETLADALTLAYNNSNLLDQNRAVLRAADEDVAVAVSALRPVINFILNSSYGVGTAYNAAAVLTPSTVSTDTLANTAQLTAEMTLYAGGANRLAVLAAKQTVLATRQALIEVEQNILLTAVQAYMGVIRSREFVELGNSNVRVISEELRAATDRFEVGEVTRTDVAIAEARLAAARSGLAAAQGDFEVAREAYKAAVGIYPGALTQPARTPVAARTEDEARAIALRRHPLIRQTQFEVTTAELTVDIATAALKPRITGNITGAITGRDRLDIPNAATNSSDLSIGLTLTQPIYQGGGLSARLRQAIALRDVTRANLLQTTLLVSQNVGVAWARLAVARASVVATEQQVAAARIAFDGVREEASLGARTTLDVLILEQELLDAAAARISAISDRAVAIYTLLSSMGLMTAEHLQLGVPTYDPEAYFNAVRNAPVYEISPQGARLDRVLRRLGKN